MRRDLYYFIGIAILALLLFRTCNVESSLKKEIENKDKEIARIESNLLAERDSVETYRSKNGSLVAEISAFQITEKELKEKYAYLFKEWEREKNKPPRIIIEPRIEIREKIVDFAVFDKQNGKEGTIYFSSDTSYSDGNYRKISGSLPFRLNYFSKNDSSLLGFDTLKNYAKVYPGNIEINNTTGISLITGLRKNKQTGRPEIWAETKYPGVTFTSLKGADIISDEVSKKTARSFRKEFAIGVHFGYGANFSTDGLRYGFNMGVGLNYSPRWLQFGK
jgi:hypothetical protein